MEPVEDVAGRIIVIGASAGGVTSLRALVAKLPNDIDAAIFVVLHVSPDGISLLPDILNHAGPLTASHPTDGEKIKRGRIYVACPDHHLLIVGDHVGVKRGPKENRFRPSIDALFRSAAYNYGARVIGVVLSGALDDGTSGLWTVKELGGVTVVQLPGEAAFDSMPLSALDHVQIDYSMSAAEIGSLIARLCEGPSHIEAAKAGVPGKQLEIEVAIAAGGDALRKGVMTLGELSSFSCPECHGVLIKLTEGNKSRFRCHTGHAYTASALLSGVMTSIGEGSWQVMRALEEAAMLLEQMGRDIADGDRPKAAEPFFEKAREATKRARLVREATMEYEHTSDETLRRGVTHPV
jgi:two-component system chemotaxis response regulator CheB